QEAEKEFQEAERLQPGEPYALYYLGSLELERGSFAKAAELLARSVKKDSLNPKAHYALGRALLRLGKVEEADKEFAQHRLGMERLYHSPRGGRGGGSTVLDSEGGERAKWVDVTEEDLAAPEDGPSPETAPAGGEPGGRFFFTDVAKTSGIDLRNVSG